MAEVAEKSPFEWEASGEAANSGTELAIKDIFCVIMPPPNTGG